MTRSEAITKRIGRFYKKYGLLLAVESTKKNIITNVELNDINSIAN